MNEKITISVAVAVYSGKDYLNELVEKIDEIRNSWIEKKKTF